MSEQLLLDEHYSPSIAARLRARGHDVLAVLDLSALRGQADRIAFAWAAETRSRVVTENIQDFRPLMLDAYATGRPVADLLLVPPRRFPRGSGLRSDAIVIALDDWFARAAQSPRPPEDWLST